jgi:DNA-directed RNA polymerase specialized sigma24 family protein
MLSTSTQIVWALITYTDWWQPSSTSVYRVGSDRETFAGDGLRAGLLDTLSERTELCRRMRHVADRDRQLLYLWYLRQLPAHEIAKELGISRRQCFRRRAAVIRRLVELGEPAAAVVPA